MTYMTFLFTPQNIIKIKQKSMNLNPTVQMYHSHQDFTSKRNIAEIRPWLYKPKKSRFGTRRNFKYNGQHWSIKQTTKYIQFLTLYIDLVKGDSSQQRKLHLNRILSKFIGTRSPVQCRSHHQRMVKVYGSPQNILKELHGSIHHQKNPNNNESDLQKKRSTEYLTLPDLQINSIIKEQLMDDDSVSLHLLDSNLINLPDQIDIYQF